MNRLTENQTANVSGATLSREHRPGTSVTRVERSGIQELHATLYPKSGESLQSLFERCGGLLEESGAAAVRHTVLGPADACREYRSELDRFIQRTSCPVIWAEGGLCSETPISGMHLMAVSGVTVETVRIDDRPVGRCFEDADARYLMLGDVRAPDLSADRATQAAMMFQNMEAALSEAGMTFHNVVRTWLFLNQLLSWYEDFNKVRNDIFTKWGVFDALVPASTGIEAVSGSGAEITGAAFALEAKHDGVLVEAVPSPLQCPAPSYGSAFSRAAQVVTPDLQRMFISGTASIALGGESAYIGDPEAQIALTMQVVEAILKSRGMTLFDTTRATAYMKHPDVAPVFRRYCEQNGLNEMPAVITRCDVCRDELLFEIELDAIAPVQSE